MTTLKCIPVNPSFTDALPADQNETNTVRQVLGAAFSWVDPSQATKPELILVSDEMAELLDISDSDSSVFRDIVSGNVRIEGSRPFAMCYGGHQFGHWAGQLGDGRAINIAEVLVGSGRWTLQLKGAGKTPYSRTADGLAVLRSSIREFLCSEAMHHLGVPTTRALSLSLSGREVLRDMLYDGHPEYEPGAIVCRVAHSFIRFGSFEIFAARQDVENLRKLTDYTINTYFSELGTPSKKTYVRFYEVVANRTREMIIHWQRVGFVHGVMNTDNMSVLGQTIDYGPYGWLEDYDPGWTPNTTDAQHKRYRFGNQPSVALWNLTQLANALYPLIEETEGLTNVLADFRVKFKEDYLAMMKSKIGLQTHHEKDEAFIGQLTETLRLTETDMTLFFRNLSRFNGNVDEHLELVKSVSYASAEQFRDGHSELWTKWLTQYDNRLQFEDDGYDTRKQQMNKVNPKYVLRNYMAQLAIDDAEKGQYDLIRELYILLKQPYNEQPEMEKWFAKRPDWAKERVGCSMLSCSS